MYEYAATLIALVDADTLKLDVDLGFRTHARQTFRLARINCPEQLTVEGMRAKLHVAGLLSKATALRISSSRSEKYGRWLCELYFQTRDRPGQWQNLNNLLLEQGYATRFKH
jgi:endonuclease YncB( thermonuclease family)